MTLLAIYFLTGLILAPFSYAMTYAYFQRKFPTLAQRDRSEDIRFALLIGFLTMFVPPLFLALIIFGDALKHGLKWR